MPGAQWVRGARRSAINHNAVGSSASAASFAGYAASSGMLARLLQWDMSMAFKTHLLLRLEMVQVLVLLLDVQASGQRQ